MNERKPGTFEEKLREVLARYRESQEAYERWLEERGLDRGAIREAARGPGSGEAPVRAERFERLRRDVDRELARDGGDGVEMEEAAVIELPPWAVKA
jgi:hypothetical protein